MTKRRAGIRIYAVAEGPAVAIDTAERARQVVLLVSRILAPISAPSLSAALALVSRRNLGLGPLGPVVAAAIKAGSLEQQEVEGEAYLWPAFKSSDRDWAMPRDVRLLSPFDPVVWDRRRFEHLWGWAYRFEAYTPTLRRKFGYYAMPLLWGDAVIGWANVALIEGKIDVRLAYVSSTPRSQVFRRALDAELGRMERFLTSSSSGERAVGEINKPPF